MPKVTAFGGCGNSNLAAAAMAVYAAAMAFGTGTDAAAAAMVVGFRAGVAHMVPVHRLGGGLAAGGKAGEQGKGYGNTHNNSLKMRRAPRGRPSL
jgi:hypothetical protein